MAQQIDPSLNPSLNYLQADQTVPQQKTFDEHQSTVTENASESSPIQPIPAPRDRSSSDSPDNKLPTNKQSAG
ncbi:hypothetical protein BGX30_013300 [Mortierella sp. GBA39]|nr:hypothetical protein BGX30_013300 [Mortierella sp. GBA39]